MITTLSSVEKACLMFFATVVFPEPEPPAIPIKSGIVSSQKIDVLIYGANLNLQKKAA